MKIAKPLLLVTTPIGIAGGVYEAYRLAGGLVFLMLALLLMISAAVGMTVLTIRREAAAERARAISAKTEAPPCIEHARDSSRSAASSSCTCSTMSQAQTRSNA